ncbi:hypothetical protein GOBAR_DD16334 [Gossypium barbadense]|nr:hypothetical protein GOBAR_DD16334 [Gossypium barbadense]
MPSTAPELSSATVLLTCKVVEMLTSPQGQKQNPPKSVRKVSPSESHKDLWLALREGSLPDVDSALTLLKKTAGTVNCRNRFGLTPLHIVTWRNHLPIIQRLLAAGADPDANVFYSSYCLVNLNVSWMENPDGVAFIELCILVILL